MLEEQKQTVYEFRKWFDKEEKLIVYGTGINAAAVIENCKDFSIIGVLDAAKTGEVFKGLKVMSETEAIQSGCKKIVIIARPSVHTIIYRRIQHWITANKIQVCDISGNLISDTQRIRNHSYFEVSYQNLLKEIHKHEVISFDIFDTLVSRCVYEPIDVFELLERELNDKLKFRFSEARMHIEQEMLQHGEPTIEEIYNQIQIRYHLSDEEKDTLLNCEIQKELEVLHPRSEMIDCLKYCLSIGKKVILVSDMYLSKAYLEKILKKFDIYNYNELFISCEYRVSKKNGLWDIVKSRIGNHSCLHIGDNEQADEICPKKVGIDTFCIYSPMRMLEISCGNTLLSHVENLETRVMIGMIALKLFQNPFVLHNTKGKWKIDTIDIFSYVYIAPFIMSFMIWMINKVKNDKNGVILFSARDGYLIQQIYDLLCEVCQLEEACESKYLLISRSAILKVTNSKEKDNRIRETYCNYLKMFQLENYQNVYFFDFMSKGTCQYELEKVIGRSIKGLYVQHSLSGVIEKDKINVQAFYLEKSALEANRRIFAMCDFLECILTSPYPSFKEFDEKGMAIYENEQREKAQIELVKKIHNIILEFCKKYMSIMENVICKYPSVKFCDELLTCSDKEYANIDIPELKYMQLDDGNHTTILPGKDLF